MSEITNTITVKILGRDYKVKCPPEKANELKESAIHLDNLMREVRESGKTLSVDRIAVIAAINVAHDMIVQKKQKNTFIDVMNRRIQELQLKIEKSLVAA